MSTTTLTIGADNTSPAPFLGTITGAGGLVKTGSGTLTIGDFGTSGNLYSSSYTGGTVVTGGTLLIANGPEFAGSATGTGPVSVNSGATLAVTVAGGNGTIAPTGANTVTINGGGNLALANGVTLTLSNGLTLQNGEATTVDLAGTPNGLGSPNPLAVIDGGNFVVNTGGGTINVTNPSLGDYDLISYGGSTLSGSGTFAIGTAPLQYGYQLSLDPVNQELEPDHHERACVDRREFQRRHRE